MAIKYAVLQSLIREIPRIISRGSIVRLGNFGSFRKQHHEYKTAILRRKTDSERDEEFNF